ncbi:DUF2079 domain-containing protein [Streptomyces sp. NBC_01619]|uniref:DUF2079 domain-containing protein n=1 Tax=Streptomyces sp. NBC_01619 TaxID=2975901 RepID=UPI00225C2C45|nr:DUF2079 domain-containing protein [Streptomyces sp. NBC_01619]MCX4515738.1 DUF2079 domain-containing protein [Streptomyces sp. NBC_01619]
MSLRIHQRMLSNSYDLGIFEQAVRSYAHGELPVSELKGPGFPILGDHFSPVLAFLGPLYRLWPSPNSLLVAQALLLAVSVIPLALWARRALGPRAALIIGAAYGLSWGIASGVGFDFHEVAFAVPLLACSLSALGQGRLHAAAWWALPLLLVKEDLGLTVILIGLVISWRGDRKTGLITAGVALGGALLALFVILPAFSPTGSYAYWYRLEGTGDGLGDLLHRSTIGLVTPLEKASTLLLVLAPTMFLALRSPLMWIAVPTFVWRFASSLSVNWGTGYHYSLVLMPIVFSAFIDALALRRQEPSRRRYLAGTTTVTLLLLPQFPLWQLAQPGTWKSEPRIGTARAVMRLIPDGATVQASTHLVPQLTNRTSVSLFGWPASRPNPQWIMVDTQVPQNRRWPLSFQQEHDALAAARSAGYSTAADEDGLVLLRRYSNGRAQRPDIR